MLAPPSEVLGGAMAGLPPPPGSASDCHPMDAAVAPTRRPELTRLSAEFVEKQTQSKARKVLALFCCYEVPSHTSSSIVQKGKDQKQI